MLQKICSTYKGINRIETFTDKYMHSVSCLAGFCNVDLQLKGYNCTCQQIGQQGRDTLYKENTFWGPQAFSFYDCIFTLIPVLLTATLRSPQTRGYRFCKMLDHASSLPWNCSDTVGWRAELRKELCSSCLVPGTEFLKSFPSFLLLLSKADNSYHLFHFQTFLSPYSGLNSKEEFP